MPECVVIDNAFTWGSNPPPRTPVESYVIYEAHVKGLTIRNPAVPRGD